MQTVLIWNKCCTNVPQINQFSKVFTASCWNTLCFQPQEANESNQKDRYRLLATAITVITTKSISTGLVHSAAGPWFMTTWKSCMQKRNIYIYLSIYKKLILSVTMWILLSCFSVSPALQYGFNPFCIALLRPTSTCSAVCVSTACRISA